MQNTLKQLDQETIKQIQMIAKFYAESEYVDALKSAIINIAIKVSQTNKKQKEDGKNHYDRRPIRPREKFLIKKPSRKVYAYYQSRTKETALQRKFKVHGRTAPERKRSF